MLELILGRSGTGKTEYIRRQLVRRALDGEENMLLIVPEQSSFANEKALLTALGEPLVGRVEVLTFTRLCDAVGRDCGGFAGTSLTDGERAVAMSLALEAVKDRLTVYTKNLQSAGTVSAMLELAGELTACSVAPEALDELGGQLPNGMLRRKLADLSLIAGTYEGMLHELHAGAKDALEWLDGALKSHPFFRGRTVALDAFHGFTAQEFRILSHILRQAQTVLISLCMEPDEAGDALSLFSPIRQTAERLKRLARDAGVAVKSPLKMRARRSTESPALLTLERGLFQPGQEPFTDKAEDVALYEAETPRDACAYVARKAKWLMRTKGMRCREMMVIARSTTPYRSELQSAFARFGVPYFEDSRQPIASQPLMRFLRGAFAVLETGFDSDAVLGYLKTGLTGHTVEEISSLENYVILWSVNRGAWLREWKNHPEGLAAAFTPKQQERLDALERVRRETVEPLLALKNACAHADGQAVAAAAFQLLQRVGVPGHLAALAQRLHRQGQSALALEQGRVWDLLMELLDSLGRSLKGRIVSAARFGELLGLLIDTQDLGQLPQGLDNISLGSADRVRPDGVKAVFLLGVNEGEFPASMSAQGVFSDAERTRLLDAGLTLFEGREELALKERFWAYLAAAAPRQYLYAVWSQTDDAGAPQPPSALVREIRRLLPRCREGSFLTEEPMELVEGKDPAFTLLARRWREPDAFTATLRRYFEQEPAYRDRVAAVERAARQTPLRMKEPDKALALFPKDMLVSASRVEAFYHCPFQYFLKFGLSAKPRRVAELDPMQTGTVIHYVLEHLLKEFGGKGLSEATPETRGARVQFYLQAYMEQELGLKEELGARFDYLFSRLADTIRGVVEQMALEFGQSLFEPVAFEADIGPGGAAQPLSVPLPDGGALSIRGQIDRVDVMETDAGRYLRVVDYKSGAKQFVLSDVLAGLNMQMLIYLIAVCRGGRGALAAAQPAGVLYMPARRSLPTLRRDAGEEEARREHLKDFRMSGMVLEDEAVLRGMERRMEGVFIPAKFTQAKGMAGTLITMEQLGRLTQKIEGLLCSMGEELHRGNVSPRPATGSSYTDTCKWCDYRSVCAGQEKPCREIPKLEHSESLEKLEEDAAPPEA